ncbi:MAG TPA: hypothetical protein ENK18_20020 [Deltaproteobacteria bacterium]|nr:hypothetical protein [Deltaproteobacteria bacterium]
MPTSDILSRIAAVLMMISAAWNGLVALLWILALIWLLVGVLWFVPLFLALVEMGLAITLLVLGHNRGAISGPIIGIIVSMCNFNFFALTIDLLALMLVIGGYVSRAQEARADLC